MIFGLFVTLGGIGHYVILVTNYKRQKDFVNRYISQARTAAWGDNNPTIANIVDTAGTSASTSSLLSPEDAETSAVPINRRERRAAERGQKKKSSRSPRNSGTSTPAEISDGTPAAGPKRRVTAENGKTLIVDSNGNVFLEEEDEEGETQQFLIDPEEITKPSFQQTIVWRFPVWIVSTIQAKVSGKKEDLKANGITVPRVMTEDGESRGGKKRSHKKKS